MSRILVFAGLFCLLSALPAQAQTQTDLSFKADPNRKFTYACDRIEVDNILQGARLLGNVVIVHGDLVLNADVIVLRYRTQSKEAARPKESEGALLGAVPSGTTEIESLTASGRVTLVRKDQRALCRQAVYHEKARTLTMTGNPQLWQKTSFLTGDRIVVYLDQEKIEVTGRQNARVSGEIVPSSLQPDLSDEAARRLEDLNANPPDAMTKQEKDGDE